MTKTINNDLKIKIDKNIYPLEAVYATAYIFLDRVYIYLENSKDEKYLIVNFKSKDNKNILDLKGEFLNELLHYVHRMNISKNNKKIREYIVERALFSAIENSEEEDDLIFDDPLGIAVPWEEKYGDKE